MTKLIDMLNKISILKFIKYNFLSKNIKRDKGIFIIPYKNAILDLSNESRIYIKGKHLHIGVNRLKGSHAETYIRMEGNSEWYVNNGAGICYNATIEIKDKGKLEMGYTFINTSSVIICSRSIKIGDNVWIGRNNTIYDNDHHQLLDNNNNIKNPIKPVIIGDRVWITNHVSILKGVKIGSGCVIGAYSVIRKDVQNNNMVGEEANVKVFDDDVRWSPELVK